MPARTIASAMRIRFVAALLMGTAAAATAAGCDNPDGPATGPQITCPVSVAVQSPTGNPVQVTYGAPTVTGGKAPVTATCSPTSGSFFSLGTTSVLCTAVDAAFKSSTCTLSVAVTKTPPPPPQLGATRFVAFGDSITEGFLHSCPGGASLTFQQDLAALAFESLRPPGEITTSYPYKLRTELVARYTTQSFVVVNEGLGGEFTADGLLALPGVLNTDNGQVLLLQEGTNDIDSIGSGDATSTISTMVSNLRAMVRAAKSRGMTVFVGTLTPQRVGACRDFASQWVEPANVQIRAMVTSESVTLADLYAAFGGVAGDLIGPDGLHPSEAGYQKIADTFFAAIKSKLEIQ